MVHQVESPHAVRPFIATPAKMSLLNLAPALSLFSKPRARFHNRHGADNQQIVSDKVNVSIQLFAR